MTGLKVGITPENRDASQKDGVRLTTGPSQDRKSAFLRQTVLYFKKTWFVPVMAFDWAKSLNYSGTSRCKTKSQCPAQQWYFTGLKVGITPENRVVCQKDSARPTNGPSQVRKSALLRQTMLQVKNSESDPVMALYWAESRHYFGKPCCNSKRQISAHYRPITGPKVDITPANHA